GSERCDLPSSVHPGVGPTCHREADVLVRQPGEELGEHALHRPDRRITLPRPATEVGPVVRERQPDDRHDEQYWGSSYSSRSTSWIAAIGAASPLGGPSLRIRV